MTIPVYDTSVLPRITLPMTNTQKASTRYLGGIAITGAVYIEINITALTKTETRALYNFWANDLKGGLEPFLVHLPIFGEEMIPDKPTLLVQFIDDMSTAFDGNLWRSKHKLKVYGTIDYVIDVNGDFIVSAEGEYTVTEGGDYVPTGNIINAFSTQREVLTWA